MKGSSCRKAGEARKLKHEVADVFHTYGEEYRRRYKPLPEQRKVMRAVEDCRTAVLGGHVEECNSCGHEKVSYNSCRNRHCPKCQALVKAQWIEARKAELLPVGYYHLVFTVPHRLNALILTNKRELLGLLFRAVSETLLEFGERHLCGLIGGTMILHTWDQKLGDHFHIHCVVPAGALTPAGQWRHARQNFLFSVRALGLVFRGKFLAGLQEKRSGLEFLGKSSDLVNESPWKHFLRELRQKPWVTYSKAPFRHPKQLLEYLGRYTHRVAISNDRLVKVADGCVEFSYRDRKHNDRRSKIRLEADEFIRRYLLHTLPKGFQRIRHFGFLANRAKASKLSQCRQVLGEPTVAAPLTEKQSAAEIMYTTTGIDITVCPECRTGRLQRRRELSPHRLLRGPPL